MTFTEFFTRATAGHKPYPFQERFATEPELPHLLRVPTGAGKTATAVLGWLWRFREGFKGKTPRRLVYCLPMRVLVEQSRDEARQWLEKLGLSKDVGLHVLMGGVDLEDWHHYPERPAILIGTQDMLLSRALNRGYGESRFHWPIDFGLLNNDALWVYDEPQLMGNGVATSAQLAGLRQALGTFGECRSVWMSATLEPTWLDTIDFKGKFPGKTLELTAADYDPSRPLHNRMTADKTLTPLGHRLTKDADAAEMKALATKVVAAHAEGTQTLVVVNTVRRARTLYDALGKVKGHPDLLLIHSRFRPHEREGKNEQLREKGRDRILVATQVVEAGVDISARTLVTELAPWASLVQRMGRCNRTGDDGPGRVLWIDLDEEKQAAPYESCDLAFAQERLQQLVEGGGGVSPKALAEFQKWTLDMEHNHVLRRRDLLDLFDTTPDLSGNDIDIARFVRSDEASTDVQFFWRDWPGDRPLPDMPAAHRRELCSVPVGDAKVFLRSRKEGLLWDHLDEEWRPIRDADREVRPGLVILLPCSAGGYSDVVGWDADSKTRVAAVPETTPVPVTLGQATRSDPLSTGTLRPWSVAAHTNHVVAELEDLLAGLASLVPAWAGDLRKAARWHDAGKGHDAFQAGMHNANTNLDSATKWAKSGATGRLKHGRPHFRHELASALAALQHGIPFAVAYLIATHHGKVRLSIRSLPDEEPHKMPGGLFAQGVHDGDRLEVVDLGGEEECPAMDLRLTPMRLGGDESWTARALELREKLGPFQLAYLEALLRAADERASKQEREGGYSDV